MAVCGGCHRFTGGGPVRCTLQPNSPSPTCTTSSLIGIPLEPVVCGTLARWHVGTLAAHACMAGGKVRRRPGRTLRTVSALAAKVAEGRGTSSSAAWRGAARTALAQPSAWAHLRQRAPQLPPSLSLWMEKRAGTSCLRACRCLRRVDLSITKLLIFARGGY